MKKTLALCTMMIFCALSGANIIKNGSFTEVNPDGMPANWKPWPAKRAAEVVIKIDNTNSKSGGQSIMIRNPHEKYYTRIDQLHIPCKPHTKYVARFWAKGKDLATSKRGGARMFIGPHGDLNRPIVQLGPGIELLKKDVPNPWSFNWTLFESNVFGSGNSKELGVTLYLSNASGTIWFDDVEIIEYTPDAKLQREAEHSRTLIRKDIEHVGKLAPELKKDLTALQKKIEKFMPPKRDPYLGMPFFAPQRELGVLFSRTLSKKFPGKNIVVSLADDPLKRTSPYFIPSAAAPEKITIEALKGEVESFAVNITNTTAKEQQLNITAAENLELEMYSVIHVETDRREYVDDALLPLKKNSDGIASITIPAGMTRQIYCNAKVKFNTSGNLQIGDKNIEITYTPKKTPFPDALPVKLWGYAYPYRFSFFHKFKDAQRIRMNMHHNAEMPYQYCVPMPHFDSKGKFQPEKMDWGKLDLVIAMTKAPEFMIFSLPVHSNNHVRDFLGYSNGKPIPHFSPEFERRITLWLKAFVKGLARRGISYDRFVIEFVDEPGENAIPYIIKINKLVKKIDKNIRTYNNFNHGIPKNKIAQLASALDIIAPEVAEMSSDKMKILKDSGKEIWCYHVQNRSYPADKMRNIFHTMRKNDVMAYSYWVFYDSSPRWMPTGGQSYTVIYDAPDGSWQPSKRAEAMREGMEIFTLLTLVKEQNETEYKNLCAKIGKINHMELRKAALKFVK